MKANAPEKIYLQENTTTDLYEEWWPEWFFARAKDTDVEYTRTDAFIEKALEFLDGCIPNYIDLKHANVDTFMNVDNKRFVDEFRNYMKGE